VAIPIYEPEIVTEGDTVTWRRYLADYLPADGWVLSYALVNSSGQITFSSTADGQYHLVSVPAATTADWDAGEYQWQAYVTKGSDRFTVGQGSITVRSNFAADSLGADNRSHARKVLDALKASMENKATSDQVAMSIRGRSISRMSPAEMIKWIDFYEKQVAKEDEVERRRRGVGSPRKIHYRVMN
jgi:hypothetical protein